MGNVYTVPWLPKNLDGLACRWFILIRKGHENDEALLLHENIHIFQMKQMGVIKYAWKYFTSEQSRAELEYEAYKNGSKWNNHQIYSILIDRYGISREVANQVCFQ